MKTNTINEHLVTQLTNGLVGWPLFKEVFSVSAINGWGVEEVKEYLKSKAKDGQWEYHPNLRTNVSPHHLVCDVIKSKCLEVLSGPVSYGIKPEINSWIVENGVLRLNVLVCLKSVIDFSVKFRDMY